RARPWRGSCLPVVRLRADAEVAALHGQGAGGRARSRSPRVALHARRHGLLLMKRLLFLTQSVDPAHPVLAATIPKLRELAQRVDEVVVLAPSADGGQLP